MLRTICASALFSTVITMSGCERNSSAIITVPDTESQATRNPVMGIGEDSDDTSADVSSNRGSTSPVSIRPYPIVMYDSANEELLTPYAERVAKLIGTKIVQASPSNPVCCVWLELTGWTPNPGKRGYIINNQAGGSIIKASDEEQLRAAIELFESSARYHDDYVEVPLGLLTNYDCYD